jgi:LysM repeat protein
MVRRWNGLRGDGLRGRTVLALHLPVTPSNESASAPSSKPVRHGKAAQTETEASAGTAVTVEDEDTSTQASPVHHRVKSGETLYSIATTYKTTVAALKRYNGNVATLRPGMILIVQPSR